MEERRLYRLWRPLPDNRDCQIFLIVCSNDQKSAEEHALPILLENGIIEWDASCALISKVGVALPETQTGVLYTTIIKVDDMRNHCPRSDDGFSGWIYRVERPSKVPGEFSSFIVVAGTEDEACQRHPDGFMRILESKWYYPPHNKEGPGWVEPAHIDSLAVTTLGQSLCRYDGEVLCAAVYSPQRNNEDVPCTTRNQ